jgi:hypothetical protein
MRKRQNASQTQTRSPKQSANWHPVNPAGSMCRKVRFTCGGPSIPASAKRSTFPMSRLARGNGAFTRYLREIEVEAQRAGLDGVYVENIFNPRLARFLRRHGYDDEPAWAPGPPCLYKRFSNLDRGDEIPDFSSRDVLQGLGAATAAPSLPNVSLAEAQALHPLATERATQVWMLHEPWFEQYGPHVRAAAIQHLTDIVADLGRDPETFGDTIRAYRDASHFLTSDGRRPRALERAARMRC